VLEVDAENGMARIEAGATGLEIDTALRRHGFTLGHEPDSFELSTLGGWIATHASGMKKNRYGNIEDLLLGIEAVTVSGRLVRPRPAPRESVGGDPARWLLGSEGRLGIITAATLKIFPLPEIRRFDSVLFKSFEDGFAFVRAAQSTRSLPASIRLMDNLQFQFGQALKPARTGLSALKSRLEKLYVLNVRGFDKNEMVACTLLYEGNSEEVAAQKRCIDRLAREHGGLKSGSENGERGYQLTFAIAYIRDFMMSHHIIAESFETAVPWTQALELCTNVKQRLWQEHQKRDLPGRPFVSCRITQLYDTGVCIYFYFAFFYKGIEGASEIYSELEQAAREEILRSGGSLSHHHGIGGLRRRFLPEVFSETALAWRDGLKRLVDPENVFGCSNR
jgi:alkyldihydroxyacetonephosphate synthase